MALFTLDGSVDVSPAAIPGGIEETEVLVGDFGRNVDGGALSSRRGQKRHVRIITKPLTAATAGTLVTKLQKKTAIAVTGTYGSAFNAIAEVHRLSSLPVAGSFRQVVEFTLREV